MLIQAAVIRSRIVLDASIPNGCRKPRCLSQIVQEAVDAPATADERLSLGHLIEGFFNRAFGVILFIYAVPVALPIVIPGLSAVLGAQLFFLSWQLMRGREQPWLPEVLCSRFSDVAILAEGFAGSCRRFDVWSVWSVFA